MSTATSPPKRTLPPWLKATLPGGARYERIKAQMKEGVLHTVCEEARCPNIGECWNGGTATFMVMGESCTRGCRFCSVQTAKAPPPPDPLEPVRLAQSLAKMELSYAVITTVCRDDLADQGAGHIALCVRAIRDTAPQILQEFLIQDFRGDLDCLQTVVAAKPDVLAHNVETVQRLTHPVRDIKAGYRQSIDVLAAIKKLDPSIKTKTSLMLGLGEREDEVRTAMADLREAGVDILTLGQYLRPSSQSRHLPVSEFVHPDRFAAYESEAKKMGFLYVASGPMVRSSYRAGELFLEGLLRSKS